MSSFELGRSGITLLALYLVVEALLAAIAPMTTLARASTGGGLFFERLLVPLAITLGVVLVIGGVPAWVLIRNRDALARRWFLNGATGLESSSPSQLGKIGAGLMGAYLLINGMIGLVGAIVAWVASPASTTQDGAVPEVVHSASGAVIEALATAFAGALLLRYARPLAERWIG